MRRYILPVFLFAACFLGTLTAGASDEVLALLYSEGQVEAAIEWCHKQIDSDTAGKPSYYLNLALLYEENGRIDYAIETLENACKEYNDKDIWFHLGRLNLLLSNNNKSVENFRKHLRVNPKNKRAYFYLGLNHEDLGKDSEALRYYRKCLHIDPYFVLPLLRSAHIYIKDNVLDKALGYLQKVEDYDPSIKSVYRDLALVYYKKTDFRNSYKYASKSLNMEPGNKKMQLVRSESRRNIGEEYFEKEKERLYAERRQITAKVSSVVSVEGVPEVKVRLAENVSAVGFKVTGRSVVYSDNKPVVTLKKDTIYRLAENRESLLLSGPESQILAVLDKPALIIPDSEKNLIGIFGLKQGSGSYWAKTSDNFYRGKILIRLVAGRLDVINIVNLEEYLYGVVPSEVSSDWPQAALAAQAVVARTRAWESLGTHKKQGYDFCNTVHCQVYLGVSKEKASTNHAVDRTRGEILSFTGEPIEIYYSSNCGGHTQSSSLFMGVKDSDKNLGYSFPLTPLANYSWVTHEPETFCQLDKVNRSRFRWQRIYTKEELEEELQNSFPFLGQLNSIRVLKIDNSSHIEELLIKGSKNTYKIISEYRIRKVIDNLRSSMFRLEVKRADTGVAEYYIFWGGGFGHGRGLCQYGAKGMAEKGYPYSQILSHYFPYANLEKLY